MIVGFIYITILLSLSLTLVKFAGSRHHQDVGGHDAHRVRELRDDHGAVHLQAPLRRSQHHQHAQDLGEAPPRRQVGSKLDSNLERYSSGLTAKTDPCLVVIIWQRGR